MRLKQIFLPTKENHYHPHAVRWTGLALVLLAVLATNGAYNWQHARTFQVLGYATSISPYEIINLTNQQRGANGLGGLNTDSQLMQAAQAKAQDMFAHDYWAHVSPSGTTPWYFITASGYTYAVAGENLAKDFNTSAGVMTGWMNSPEHRANILNGSYHDIGVAVMNGVLQGGETTLVVAMYGSRAAAPAPTPKPALTQTQQLAAPTASAPADTTPTATAPAAEQPTAAVTPSPTATADTTPKTAKTAAKPAAVPATTSSNSSLASARSVSVKEQLNWAQQVTVFILLVILLMNVFKHTIVWRTQRRGWRHIWLRAHPVAQYMLILVTLAAVLLSAQGVIR